MVNNRELEIQIELDTNLMMIGFTKKSGKNPNQYVKRAKKLLKRLKRVNPESAWMYEATLERKLRE